MSITPEATPCVALNTRRSVSTVTPAGSPASSTLALSETKTGTLSSSAMIGTSTY